LPEGWQGWQGWQGWLGGWVGWVVGGADLLHRERDVLPRRGAGDEGEAEGVGAVRVECLEWVDDVALGLGHLLAFACLG